MVGHRKFKKALLISGIAIVLFVVVVIVIASPLAKRMIEKYDEKYTGRQIEIGWLYINPFTGYLHLSNLKVYEHQSKDIFFSVKGLTVNLSVLKLLSKVYEIKGFTLDTPWTRIVQNGKEFNFSDIVQKFSGVDTLAKKDTSTIKFNILNVKIKNGEFHYIDKQGPINYFVKNFDFYSKGKKWDVDTVAGKYSFQSGPGTGSIKGDFSFNTKSLDYRLNSLIDKFDLKIMEQYMKAMANYGQMRATMDANLGISGKVNDSTSMTMKGRLAINDFHFGKSQKEDYGSFDKLVLKFREINLAKGYRMLDTVLLVHPVLKYEKYDKLDNIQLMFGENGSKIDSVKSHPEKFNLVLKLADYIKMISKTFTRDYFKINSFAIENADLIFNDYSLSEKFSMGFKPFTVTADSIDKNRERITIKMKTLIEPHGEASASLSVNPRNNGYFDLNYKFLKIPATMFNPYLVTFTSFPLNRGTIDFYGNWNVDNGIVKSDNHFLVIDPRASKKIKKKDNKWIPMPLILSFVRERGNVIDYKIPIKGNLKNPKFKIADVITDLIKNIFQKPPSSPYIFEVRNVENKVEKTQEVKWAMRIAKLLPNQEKFIKKIAGFLKENPEAFISVNPIQYADKEKEHIVLFEAKKKYFLAKNEKQAFDIQDDDSVKIEKMSIKDSTFLKFLAKKIRDTSLITVQQKCLAFLGKNFVQNKFEMLEATREREFLKYFKENGTEKQVKIMKAANTVPYDGFSYYKISYKNEIPEDLLQAYNKLEEIDSESPRKHYKKWRQR